MLPANVWKLWSSGARARPCHCAGPRWRPGTAETSRNGELALDLDAHRPGGAGDDLLGGLDRVGVQVWHLGLGDAPKLRRGDRADLGLVRLLGALVDARRL